jgi:hypothetical protein
MGSFEKIRSAGVDTVVSLLKKSEKRVYIFGDNSELRSRKKRVLLFFSNERLRVLYSKRVNLFQKVTGLDA